MLDDKMIKLYDEIQDILHKKKIKYTKDDLKWTLNPLDTEEKTNRFINWLKNQKDETDMLVISSEACKYYDEADE